MSQRIAVLHTAPEAPTSMLAIDPARMRAIDAEFTAAEPRIAQELLEEHLATLS